jgi:hypothetical protein
VFQVLFKKLPIAAVSMTSNGRNALLSRGAALLNRACGLCSESVELWATYADFMEVHVRADCAVMLDIRLNAYRNCQKQGWATSAEAFPVVVGEDAVFCFGTLFFPVFLRSVFAAESLRQST